MPLPLPYQKTATLDTIVKYIWDINAVPRQSVFELLAINCKDELEREKLYEFSTSEGLEDLIAYANRPRRTIVEVLRDFPHAASALTIPMLFEIFQIIKPRSYSIASVPETGTLDLLVAVTVYKTSLSKKRLGLCTNWLKSLSVGEKIFGTITKVKLVVPNSANLILVGPGTGIAPFRSILLQREAKDLVKGEVLVFFGCRNKDKDFYCKEDFERFEAKGLAKCITAFSRDQEEKEYVQDMIRKNASYIKDLILRKNAVVLVAGNMNNMPKAVKEAFIEVVGSAPYIDYMVKIKRYQEETWA